MVYLSLVLKLIKTLPDFNCVDDEGNNICHHLAKYGDKKIFNKLSNEHSPNWNGLLNQRNDNGQTPLHLAIQHNNQELANKFVKLGANKNILDINGNSCIKVQNGGGLKNEVKIQGKRTL